METITAQPDAARKWYEIWWDVWRHPGAEAFRRILQEPDADYGRGFKWVAVTALIEALFISLFSAISLQRMAANEFSGVISGLFIYLICAVILIPIATVIGVAITAAIYHLIAKLFGGNGEWGQLVFCFSAVQTPLFLLTALLGFLSVLISIPVLLGQTATLTEGTAALAQGMSLLQCCLYLPSMALSIYSIVLYVCAIKAVEIIDTGRSIATYFAPVIIAIVLGCCLSIAAIISSGVFKTTVGSFVTITPVARPQVRGAAAGDPNAPVLVEVYEDFQCPACDEYSKTVETQLMSNEIASGKVHYVFRHFPIIDRGAANGESHLAANASLCAADQGRFWDYHDMLFANQTGENVGDFTNKRLVAFANSLGLDMNAFNACFNPDRFKGTIDADINAGTIAGVSGTPSVFVDGKEVSPGFLPAYSAIQVAIRAALAAKGK